MDDAVFWIDWIVTAVSAFFLFLLAAAQANKAIGTPHVFVAVVVLGMGGMVIPFAFRLICYDGKGNIKGWVYVVVANVVGLLVLLSSVAAGVKAYGA
ncbi:hypothetical protein ACSDR0_46755 [Streptosporangium sp. G11]|uniref:hypothetical protein n=1 Tax=Streptosporangium sp. G11 TaxID=3436926 RepID=UPI003EB7CE56